MGLLGLEPSFFQIKGLVPFQLGDNPKCSQRDLHSRLCLEGAESLLIEYGSKTGGVGFEPTKNGVRSPASCSGLDYPPIICVCEWPTPLVWGVSRCTGRDLHPQSWSCRLHEITNFSTRHSFLRLRAYGRTGNRTRALCLDRAAYYWCTMRPRWNGGSCTHPHCVTDSSATDTPHSTRVTSLSLRREWLSPANGLSTCPFELI